MTDIHSQRLTLSLLFFAHISCGYRLTRALTRIIIMIMEKGEKIIKMMKKQKNNSRLNCKLARLNLYYFLRSCNPLSMKWGQSMTSSMWYLLCCVYEKIILYYCTDIYFMFKAVCWLSIKRGTSVTLWARKFLFYFSYILSMRHVKFLLFYILFLPRY